MVSMFRDKFVINEKVNSDERRSCRERYARWDKPIAGIVGILTFLTIIGCLIYDIYSPTNTIPNVANTNSSKSGKIAEDYCSLSECEVLCDKVPPTIDVEESIQLAIANANCAQISHLHIKDSQLPGNKLPENWLQNLGTSVTKLTLTLVPITTIDDGAFAAATFSRTLAGLELAETDIHYLGNNTLRGLQILNLFFLQFYQPNYISFESGFLQHTTTLQTLQLTFCLLTSETISNLTNADSVLLGSLQVIDFTYSFADRLDGHIFSKARNVRAIYLYTMGLTYVDVDIFRDLKLLTLVHLDDNHLVTLAEGIFSDMQISKYTRILLNDNYWRCDCDLEWLQKLYIDTDYIDKSPGPNCYFDNRFQRKYIPFDHVEFCPETSTETSSSTISTTTTDRNKPNTTTEVISTISTTTTKLTSTESSSTESSSTESNSTVSSSTTTQATTLTTPSGIFRRLECRDWKRSPILLPEPFVKEYVYTQQMMIHEETVRFTFYEIYDDDVVIGIDIEADTDLSSYHLLWFNSRNTSDTGCTSNFDNTILINEMKRNNTYTICVMYGDDATVTPYDCFGFRVRVEYQERAWLRNKSKTVILAISITILVVSMLLSTIFMYLCVRFHPRMIKGNKSVVIIGKSREQPVRSEEYERPNYFTPSIASYMTSQSGYMTPANGYCRIKDRHKNYGLRNIQEESLYNSDVAYVRPKVPSADQLSSWRISNLRDRFSNENLELSNSIYEPVPPPLPPPNKKGVVIEENFYTTV